MKTCTKCGETKPLDEFSKHKLGKQGRRPRCKTCTKVSAAEYRDANRAKCREAVRNHWYANRERLLEEKRARHVRDYDKHAAAAAEYRKSEAGLSSAKRGKAKRRAAIANVPSDSWCAVDIHKEAGGRCLYCGETVLLIEMHADHFIPLAKGGTNLRDNIVCSCAFCNISKHDKLPQDFISPKLIGGSK